MVCIELLPEFVDSIRCSYSSFALISDISERLYFLCNERHVLEAKVIYNLSEIRTLSVVELRFSLFDVQLRKPGSIKMFARLSHRSYVIYT